MRQEVLTVIDMQQYFYAYVYALNGVLRQIKYAKSKELPIILVHYEMSGPIVKPVLLNVKGYEKLSHVYKTKNDGSEKIINALKKLNIEKPIIRLCGVNTCFCVAETYDGLVEKDISVRLMRSAVACDCYRKSTRECLKTFLPKEALE